MSRSEHGRIRDRNDPHDRARKREIKTRIIGERRHLDTDMPTVSADAIPIDISDRGVYVHYPASIEDLRAVMARLPEGSLNGIAGIELALSARDTDDEDIELDPLVGRPHRELLPGLYAPRTLGVYSIASARIRLYAYVYDPDVFEHGLFAAYLRGHMLSTLVHELGHHLDFRAHTTRGRWQPDPRDPEAHALAVEEQWLESYVVPYVEDTYPDAVSRLDRWFVEHVGTRVPLGLLIKPSEHLFGADDAFVDLVRATRAGRPTIEDRLDVAFKFHYDEHFELALAVIDHVLGEAPEDERALSDRAHVLAHLERFDEADAIARALLARDDGHIASLVTLRASAIRKREWRDVVSLSSRLLELRGRKAPVFAGRARAYIELGESMHAERDLAELRALANEDDEHAVRALEELGDTLRECGYAEWADRL